MSAQRYDQAPEAQQVMPTQNVGISLIVSRLLKFGRFLCL